MTPGIGRRIIESAGPPVATFVVLTALAEAIIRASGVSPLLLPTPSAVIAAAWQQHESLFPALGDTTLAVVIGLGLSTITGILIAIALSTARWIERAFYPYAVFFQLVPIVAIAPLLVIWLDFGLKPVIASAFIVSIFPVIANTLAGLLAVDPNLRDLMRAYGAGPLATLWKLKLPGALPSMLTGLRVASGLAVIGAVVGEFMGGGGLGVIVLGAIRLQRTDIVFAAVLYAALLGLALFGIVGLISRLALRHWER